MSVTRTVFTRLEPFGDEPALASPRAKRTALRTTIRGLDPSPFAGFFQMDNDALLALGIRRIVAPADPGWNYPCRVSLDFAEAGDELLLLNYRHLDHPGSPYRSEGPIFIRRGAKPFAGLDTFPPVIMQRPMSLRGYDAERLMQEGEIAEGEALQALTRAWLARPDIVHVDVHSMRRGCFFCRIYRA